MAVVVLVWALPAAAGEIALQPRIGMLAGGTSYGLRLDNVPGAGGLGVGSELDYPLNFPLAGLRVSLGAGRLTVVASLATNLDDPYGSMEDEDYVTGSGSQQTIAYTESSAEARVVFAELCGRIRLTDRVGVRNRLALDLLLGYRHQLFVFDVHGAEGWVLGASGQRVPAAIDDDVHALHYVGHHALPFVGLGLTAAWRAFRLDAGARVLAVISANHDDHVLRNKEGDGRAYGAGFAASVSPRWRIAGRAGGWGLWVGPELELQYLYGGGGTLEQCYYDDDPTMPGDQHGQTIPDSDFSVSSLQLRAMVGAGFTF
jgi:hypothetical protein